MIDPNITAQEDVERAAGAVLEQIGELTAAIGRCTRVSWTGRDLLKHAIDDFQVSETNATWVVRKIADARDALVELHMAVVCAGYPGMRPRKEPDWEALVRAWCYSEMEVQCITPEGMRLQRDQRDNMLHFTNTLMMAFEPPPNVKSLAAWLIDTYCPTGRSKLANDYEQWLKDDEKRRR